jgi:dTDP-L-rhamnose 4-epimerase
MKVVVTGGAGFIGSHIVDRLVDGGHAVICIDSLDPGVHHAPPSYLRTDVDYCFTDLRHWRPDDRFADVEGIVHLAALGGVSRAAREPENIIGGNAGGTARLVEVSAHWPRLRSIVLASSFSVYGAGYRYRCNRCGGEQGGERQERDLDAGQFEVLCTRCGAELEIQPITEATPPAPLETYGASKYMQELCFRGYAHCPVHIMRFSSVYGTRLRLDDGEATIIAKIAGWIRAGRSPELFEDGRQIRDWVHVSDVVAAATTLLGCDGPAQLVNVCSGTPTTLVEACTHLAELFGVTAPPVVRGGYRPGDMRHCLGDPSTLERLIGRRPLTFREGAASAFAS